MLEAEFQDEAVHDPSQKQVLRLATSLGRHVNIPFKHEIFMWGAVAYV